MPDIVNEVATARRAERREAQRLYVEILRRIESPKPDDAEKLTACMRVLGIDDLQLDIDAKVIVEALRHEAAIAGAESASDELQKLAAQLAEIDREFNERFRAYREKRGPLEMQHGFAYQAIRDASGGKVALSIMCQKHPHLFPVDSGEK